jgi:hypothetical protein
MIDTSERTEQSPTTALIVSKYGIQSRMRF